jgi:serine/threonine protein kinase
MTKMESNRELDPKISTAAWGAAPEKPKLTYSQVIRRLVDQLTRRSPYLADEGDRADKDMIPLLSREEIRAGQFLGQGNFSNVFEVVGFQLKHQLITSGGRCKRIPQDPEEEKMVELRDPLIQMERQRRSLASDPQPSRYALKCLKPELLEKSTPKVFLEAATDLVMEAKFLSKLNHPNILKLQGLAAGWESAFANGQYDSFFILVDRLEDTLTERIKRWRKGEYPEENTLENKVHVALQVASALSYLHDRNLVFRDLKPQNIGLKRLENGSVSVQLFDFGFCRELPMIYQSRDDIEAIDNTDATTLPSGETVFLMSGKGTRRYMAVEVLMTNRFNLKADGKYSWSLCFFLLLLG